MIKVLVSATSGFSIAEQLTMCYVNNVPLTNSQRSLLQEELGKPKYAGLSNSARLVELSKSESIPGSMPRASSPPGAFAVLVAKAALIADALDGQGQPSASAPQLYVWSQFRAAAAAVCNQDSVDLYRADVRGGLGACLVVGLVSQEDYDSMVWEDSTRTASWTETTLGPASMLLLSDLEDLI